MCGINGALIFDGNDFEVTPEYITRARDTMVHRGPDGGDTWISPDRRVGLGFRRLAIIDLSHAADQPMCNEDGSIWISFNGEMYNHTEVRRELEAIGGHRWKTDHSDTEVIVHAFEEWGIDCLARFRGMFGIAVWDARNRELWLGRDRIGIKPLYYSIHDGRAVFASEIKALLTDPDQKREVSEEGLFHYLSHLTVPAPATLFAGISKLSPGTWLRIQASGAIREHRYWDVWDHTEPLIGVSDDEIAERVLAELRTAVSLRKVSDVPVGVFLSGGIDSSTNAALFSEGEAQPVKTFSIGYDRDYQSYTNELHYAETMARTVGADHHVRILNQQDLLSFLPEMIHLQDEPIADPVCVPVYYVSKLARDSGVIVCQVGEGADELFNGYASWAVKLRLAQYNDLPVPRALKAAGLTALRAFGKDRRIEYDLLQRGASGLPVAQGLDNMSHAYKLSLLSPRLRQEHREHSTWDLVKPIWDRYRDNAWEHGKLNWMSYLDLSIRLPELLLMRVDKMSMAVSLEGRVPFLDHKFVELAMSIPESVKTRNHESKYILKKAVRGVIPDELIDRKKQGFGAPVYDWFFDELGEVSRTEVGAFCRRADYLDPAGVQRVFDAGDGMRAWTLLNLALWWREYIANEPLPALGRTAAAQDSINVLAQTTS